METRSPPVPARPLRVTVPLTPFPPTTVLALSVKVVRTAGLTVMVDENVTVPNLAVILPAVAADTGAVLNANDAAVPKPGILALVGIVTGPVADRATVSPATGASPSNRKTPSEVMPPVTAVGEI